jgi:serine/threonine protein kinase
LNPNGKVEVNLLSLRSIVQLKTRDSLPFISPEVIKEKMITNLTEEELRKADIWSFGVTAIQLATGVRPYSDMSIEQMTSRIKQKQPPPIEREAYSEEFRSMLDSCFHSDISQRATAEELLSHPFFLKAEGSDFIKTHLLDNVKTSLAERVMTYNEDSLYPTGPNVANSSHDENKPKEVSENSVVVSQNTDGNYVPIETYLGETDTHYVILLRALPSTTLSLQLETQKLKIAGTIPSLPVDSNITLLTNFNEHFEKIIEFPTPIDATKFDKEIYKNSFMIILKIRKFVPVDLGRHQI